MGAAEVKQSILANKTALGIEFGSHKDQGCTGRRQQYAYRIWWT